MKVAIKALNAEHGKEVIKYLESIGGDNTNGKSGYCRSWNTYFIDDYGHIDNYSEAPENYTLIELNQNNMQQYKSFAITGSQPLLKAMEETLVKEGFKSSNISSFIRSTDHQRTHLISNHVSPDSRENYLELCAYNGNRDFETFNLPEQWNEALEFILGQLKPKIEVGDWVVVLKLSKYSKNKIGEVKQVVGIADDCVFSGKKDIVGFALSEMGGYWEPLENIRLATPEEIEAAQTIKIGSYKAEKVGNTIKFGCQSFTKEELQAYKKLLNDNINAKIEISGTTITKDILDRLINKL